LWENISRQKFHKKNFFCKFGKIREELLPTTKFLPAAMAPTTLQAGAYPGGLLGCHDRPLCYVVSTQYCRWSTVERWRSRYVIFRLCRRAGGLAQAGNSISFLKLRSRLLRRNDHNTAFGALSNWRRCSNLKQAIEGQFQTQHDSLMCCTRAGFFYFHGENPDFALVSLFLEHWCCWSRSDSFALHVNLSFECFATHAFAVWYQQNFQITAEDEFMTSVLWLVGFQMAVG